MITPILSVPCAFAAESASTAAAQPANPVTSFRIVFSQWLDVCATVPAAKYKVNFVPEAALRLWRERCETNLPRDLIVRSRPGIVGEVPSPRGAVARRLGAP